MVFLMMLRKLSVLRLGTVMGGLLMLAACSTPATKTGTTPPEDTALESKPVSGQPVIVTAQAATEKPVETDLSAETLDRLLTAEIAGQRGHIHTAIREYLAAARESQDPAVAERATRIAVYGRDDASALEAAKLWTKLQPHNIEAHQVAAAMYVRAGKVKQAHYQLELILADSKRGDRQAFMLITALLSKEKDKKMALQVMGQLVANRQDNPEALYAYAQLALLVGDLDKARQAAEQVAKLRPAWAETHILLSNILFRKGDNAGAMAELKSAVERYPDNARLRDYYARRLVDQKQYVEAREQFQALLERYPSNHEAEYALGLLAMQLQDLDAAESHFQHLVDIKNRVFEANYYLAQIAEHRDQLKKAIQLFSGVAGGRYQIDAQLRIALIEARMGKVDQARERLHEIQPESAELEQRLYLTEGEILTQAKRYQEAFDLYNEALSKMPDNLSLLYARALSAEKIDKTQIALADLKKLVEADPANVQALNAYGYTLVDRTDQIKEGFEYIQRAYKMKSDDPAILDSLGWAYYRLGNYREAIKYLRQALDRLKDAEIAAHLGEVLWVSGDHDQARTVWNAALRETPSHKVLLNVIKRFTE